MARVMKLSLLRVSVGERLLLMIRRRAVEVEGEARRRWLQR